MKFNAKEDIDAPVDVVFNRLTDFDHFERQALRRGASVKRLSGSADGVGNLWDVAFSFRGRERRMRAEITQFDAPNYFHVSSEASGIVGETHLEFVPLSPRRTRLTVTIDLSAKSLSARLLLQSLKLARGTLSQRLKKRVASFGEDVASKYSAEL